MKTDDKIKDTYKDKELEILLEKTDLSNCNFSTYRSWTMINFLLATGVKLRTIINMRIKDLDFNEGYIYLRKVKNRKQQIIPISKSLSKILQEYLFSANHGEKISSSGVRSAIRRYNLRRGVNKTSIHLFRHTFCKKAILSGMDIFRLQKIMGHSSIEVTQKYANMFKEDLKKDFFI